MKIVIPAYNPDDKLLRLIKDFYENGIKDIIVINDGSSSETVDIFSKINEFQGVSVISHDKNRGKGAALKSAFSSLAMCDDSFGCITVDADGQHSVKDTIELIETAKSNPEALILGVRNFNDEDTTTKVPLRSKIGNNLTKFVTSIFLGEKITDAQTGLRYIPRFLMNEMLKVKANRYEFEQEMLIKASRLKLKILQKPIETIYLDGNSTSHFNPFLDSLRIYGVFFRYAYVGLASFVLDNLIYNILGYLGIPLRWSLGIARILSGIFNFTANKFYVFKTDKLDIWEILKYISLCIFSYFASYAIIYILRFVMYDSLAKITADILSMLLNYYIQAKLIFVKKK